MFLTLGERLGFLTPEVIEYVEGHGTLAGAPGVPDSVREPFIEPRQHLLIQAATRSML